MKSLFLAAPLAALPLVLAPLLSTPRPQEEGMADMAAMMEKAKKYTQPGEHHALLERFLGRWKTETRLFMGGQATDPEPGTSEFSWLMPGRWLQNRSKASMMGMPIETFMLLGYDNFKQSYVTCSVNSMDTAMIRVEGDLDPSGKALISYGTLDEYLTGEHDKMVKSVWRFRSEDEMALEVHDLPIGETNTKVFEITFRREES